LWIVDKVDPILNKVDFVADLSPVSATVDFVASVHRALVTTAGRLSL